MKLKGCLRNGRSFLKHCIVLIIFKVSGQLSKSVPITVKANSDEYDDHKNDGGDDNEIMLALFTIISLISQLACFEVINFGISVCDKPITDRVHSR